MEDTYIGKILDNRYEILEKIGSGGMAVVYKARCHRLNRFVAIKILKSDLAQDAEFRRRFHAESQAVAMLSHPNIVAVYDVNSSENIDYIVMELIEGITLKQYINRKGVLNWKEALHFITQITKALSHAHSRGIIHRDIKPHNIMVLKDGSVKVADFGIARLLSTQNTLTQQALGSVHYISPEQAKGSPADARSDLYSAGVVLYEMLTSRLPFEGDSPVSIAIQHISSIPLSPSEINPDIPAGLEDITMHAMQPNIETRYQSADEMLLDLEEFRKNPTTQFDYTVVSAAGKDLDSTRVIGGTLIPTKDTPKPVKRKTKSSSQPASADEYRKNKRRAGRATTLIGVFFIIVFLIGIAWFMWDYAIEDWLAPQVERITVTNFVGKTEDAVLNDPTYNALYTFEVVYEESETYPKGQIISQDPSADRSIALSDELINVVLTVSSGKRVVLMPDIYNMDYREASILLESYQLDLKIECDPIPDEAITIGHVIEQIPAADTELIRGMSIFIAYSSGPDVAYTSVPDVINFTEQQAILRLQSYELSYEIEEVYSDEVEKGRVIYQSWPAGEMIPIHTKVTIQVSLGPEVVEPPDPPITDPDPGDTTDPGTGGDTTDPGTGGDVTDPGTNPGTGGDTTDPGTGGDPTDPGQGTTPPEDNGTGEEGDNGIEPQG